VSADLRRLEAEIAELEYVIAPLRAARVVTSRPPAANDNAESAQPVQDDAPAERVQVTL
jgi:hypothetical protein